MKVNFVTIFPNYFETFKSESIVKKAIEKGLVEIDIIDFRNYTDNKHNKVDDIVYGGGQGMLLMIQPIDEALQKVNGRKILLSPQGKQFIQSKALELSQLDEVTFVAGHYEGFDERVRELVDEELSIGDYVLTGGEIPAMAMADATIRLIPGVIKEESHKFDSFQKDIFDFPQYTRPREYKGMKVPEVLLNGNHKEIKKWRSEQAINKTKAIRPDLLERKQNEK